MPFDLFEFLRKHAHGSSTLTLTIKGHGTITLKGLPDDPRDLASIANLLAKQEPSRKVLLAMIDLVGGQTPTAELQHGLADIVKEQAPTEELLKTLAILAEDAHPNLYADLVQHKRATRSTLNILVSILAKQEPAKKVIQGLADTLIQQSPTTLFLEKMASLVPSSR